jgi:hypothetical protein
MIWLSYIVISARENDFYGSKKRKEIKEKTKILCEERKI